MYNQEFCYWLQGYFEIGGPQMTQPLQPFQLTIIRNHLNLTKKVDGLKLSLCIWLDRQLRAIERGFKQPDTNFTKQVKLELNKVFVHDIDNSYPGWNTPGKRQLLLDVHQGPRTLYKGPFEN